MPPNELNLKIVSFSKLSSTDNFISLKKGSLLKIINLYYNLNYI